MKENASPRKSGAGRKGSSGSIPHLPMEWMDPMSWRLPSGKALAEFALQAGFLAPLILSGPRLKKKKTSSNGDAPAKMADTSVGSEEVPDRSGTFRGQR
jgi:hypothetical protein